MIELHQAIAVSRRRTMVSGYPEVYSHFHRKTRRRSWHEPACVALDRSTHLAIRDRFVASNDAFAREHFGVSWSELCPPWTCQRSTFEPESAQPREIMRVEKTIAKRERKFAAPLEKFGGRRSSRRAREAALAE